MNAWRKDQSRKYFLGMLLCTCCFLASLTWALAGQANTVASQNNPRPDTVQKQDSPIRVSVEEVRIDAVVVDKNGRQIADLAADDFEIYQDGKPQKVLSSTYVTDSQARPGIKATAPDASKMGPASTSMLPRDQIRRTLVFVVDDLSMTFEQLYYARMSIEKFLETQMQRGDLVSIVRTTGGIGAMQIFSSDKRQLLSTARALHWGAAQALVVCGANGCAGSASSLTPGFDSDNIARVFDSQVATIHYCIAGLRDMPGRKSLLLLTARSTFTPTNLNFPRQNEFMYMNFFNRLADEALRGGIVIHTLDIKGLDSENRYPTGFFEKYVPLSGKTGGIVVDNSNFFVSGIGPVEEQLKGYYLLSYVPPANTFVDAGIKLYHRIQIKVKRSGCRVRSRDGFFGNTDTPKSPANPNRNRLHEAVFSPFLYDDLKLALASGYAHVPKPGYFIRSWLHLSANDLTFHDEKDGGHSLSLELATLTASSSGIIQDSRSAEYTLSVKDEDLPRAKKEGINFDFYMPVKSPGNYYVRAAIRDRATGKVGSAYQFLEIPDLKKGRLSISSIFVANRSEDLSAVQSGKVDDGSRSSSSSLKWKELPNSPALRSYLPGGGFNSVAIIYNAKSGKGSKPELESRFTIYKDGKEYSKGTLDAVSLGGADDLARIPIAKKLTFGKGMEEGNYVLQLTVTDKKARKKTGIAVQAIDFEIRKNLEPENTTSAAF